MTNTINTNTSTISPLQAKANATSNPNGSTSLTSLGSTFLNLLTQELKNQDPTAPMDAMAMVGQMISLNQLDQLISINQTLNGVAAQPQASTTALAASNKLNAR